MNYKKILDIIDAINSLQDIDEVRHMALVMIRKLMWFDMAGFWLFDPLTGLPYGPPVTVNIPTPERHLEIYREQGSLHQDVVYQAARSSNQVISRSTDVVDYSWWVKHEQYNLIYRPIHAHYHLGCELKNGRQVFGGLCFFRSKSTGDFSLEDIQLMNVLHPHLTNRLRWHHLLSQSGLAQPSGGDLFLGHPFSTLTDRELEVVRLILTGATNDEIAERMCISRNTVKTHLKRVFSKLGIKNRGQLLALHLTGAKWAAKSLYHYR